MTRLDALSSFGTEFEPFLHAPVAAEPTGSPLSVLSALARRDVDPWETAARLARLPRATAVEQLVALISDGVAGAGTPQEIELTAMRLAALLPRPGTSAKARPRAAVPGNPPQRNYPAVALIVFYAVFMVLLQFSQAFKNSVPGPVHDDRPAVTGTGTGIPRAPAGIPPPG
jgi:hypothetical protein